MSQEPEWLNIGGFTGRVLSWSSNTDKMNREKKQPQISPIKGTFV